MKGKQLPPEHEIDQAGQLLLRKQLPPEWLLRDYRPDYGLDFTIELFGEPGASVGSGEQSTKEALGEHIFLQLKSRATAERQTLTLHPSGNVEKPASKPAENPVTEKLDIDVVPVPLETSELVTVQRMGAGVPVLLVVADLATSSVFFVCLNDYIDKVILPSKPRYWEQQGVTIHVPTKNRIGGSYEERVPIRFYGRRPKLLAAFQKFVYQQAELAYIDDLALKRQHALYFAEMLLRYDFWESSEWWAVVANLHRHLVAFTEGKPLSSRNYEGLKEEAGIDPAELDAWQDDMDLNHLWHRLALLPRNYEELCREWFLPTYMGQLLTS